MYLSRRAFCTDAAATLLLPSSLLAQIPSSQRSTSRPDVAAIDHDRILTAAANYLKESVIPLTALPCPRNPGTPNDFYSEAEDYWPDEAQPSAPWTERPGKHNPEAFTAHRDALLHMAMAVPALTAAFALTHEEPYAAHAVAHLRAWFITPATNMVPKLETAAVIRPAKTGRPEGLVEAVQLAEVTQSIPFLATSESLTPQDATALTTWFITYLDWLNNSRLAGLARDQRNHHGSSWLLQAAACARLNTKDDRPLTALRQRFKSTTIRAQITADGNFPRELTTLNPYRNTLFNLDLLAGVCELVTTRFESVWDYDLQDGPGMRSVIARNYPFMLDRGTWPYRADAAYFQALPLRRPCLLFSARAYTRPEYADLWRRLPPDTDIPELQQTFPIRQPLLWVTRPRP